MKLLKRNISAKDGSGHILLRPDTPEDLWHAYNLLQPPTDFVRCTTLRKVVNTSSTGSTTSSKVRTNLKVRVEKVDFDPTSLTLRLSGPNVEESKVVKMGAYHTLTLELGRNFSIEKECWDQIYLDRIEEACQPERGAEVAAVVMQPGLAHLCLVTGSLTITKARIDTTIPKKRTGSSNHSKALNKFYEAIYQAILRHVDFTKIKCMLCASPGYVKDDFFKYMSEQSVRRDDRAFIENKRKFVLCKASSGHKHALEEVFSDASIMDQMNDTKVAKEVEILNKFMRMIDSDPDKAYYGYNHVHKANEELAIDSLMVTDELFRSSDIATRKKYVQLVESVRENGGQVYLFSSLHVSGVQLNQLSGVAAILRYPLPDLDQMELDAAAYHDGGGEGGYESSDSSIDSEKRVQEDLADMGLL
mmetsp:Transcript_15868/g.23864  ORF Transcript_15868/g.23864 Transcript_15868/m.23864 type:complete len:417 (-) Transcript_15868:768-2018(-)